MVAAEPAIVIDPALLLMGLLSSARRPGRPGLRCCLLAATASGGGTRSRIADPWLPWRSLRPGLVSACRSFEVLAFGRVETIGSVVAVRWSWLTRGPV